MKVAKVMCHVVMNSAEIGHGQYTAAAQDTSPEQKNSRKLNLALDRTHLLKRMTLELMAIQRLVGEFS